ncbi:chromosomal replication initiator protein DnaA [Candidatus Saccharibacteria bacterium]|nr:chromosomal replication initiator protein DnaA [Candidatus Saccharibacteria bacterium]
MQDLWSDALKEMESTIPHAAFQAWFKNIELISHDKNLTIIGVANIFAKSQFEKKFNEIITTSLKNHSLKSTKIEYIIISKNKKPTSRQNETATATIKSSLKSKSPLINNGLNPRYQFSNFIIGSNNDLAVAACQAVVKNPGTKYNPLFLYGGSGLGKTHLMQAVGNEITKNNPLTTVLYTTIESFYKEFVAAMRFTKGFSDKYRNVDVLIVDDMQFITGKEKSQEEFFHTFNDLHQKNKQIIISSDRPPREIPTLTDRLRNRFEWGMAIDIQMPDFETRSAIIESKASSAGFELPSEVTEFLATNIKTNIRELEGSLNQLLAYCEMRGVAPDLSIAEGLTSNLSTTARPRYLTPKQVINKTAQYFQISPKDICSAERSRHIAEPRQIAMFLLRNELKLSYPKIAIELGRKDHTTALHSIKKIEKAIKLDHFIREQVNEIREKLYV